MKYRTLLVVALLAVLSAGAYAAEPLRVGLEFGSPSGVIILRPAPFDIKIGYDFTGVGSDPESDFFHVSGDFRIIDQQPLIEFVSFYFGAGAYMQIMTGDADDAFVLGARMPVGLQAFFIDGKIEVFLEIVPTLKLLPAIVAFEDWHGFVGITVPVSLFNFRK